MRFEPQGPEIPQELLANWLRGDVIFLAGAGVSVSAGLPTFASLSVDVCQTIDAHLATVLATNWNSEADIRSGAISASLPPTSVVEATLHYRNEFDRVFAAWERRFDCDSSGRVISQQVRAAVATRLSHHTGPQPEHRDLLRLSSVTSIGSSGILSTCRVATTNFDRLFEAAWPVEFTDPIIESDARSCARPGAYDFAGIIHVHGRLPAHGAQGLSSLVLTSRDFARGYLRGGVVANFMHDMVRRYDVVLVGYSANDPVMRYLLDAIAEDVSLFRDMHKVYALVNEGTTTVDTAITQAEWGLKNAIPISYPAASPSQHSHLWSTISTWAEWKRMGASWIDAQLGRRATVPFSGATDFDKEFVRELFELLDEPTAFAAASQFAAVGADVGWLEPVLQGMFKAAGLVP